MTCGPIRVVVFSQPPKWEPGGRRFLCRLEKHPEIAVAGVFCQADDSSRRAWARSVWRRRGALALPILAADGLAGLSRAVLAPEDVLSTAATIAGMRQRIHYVPDLHAAEVIQRIRALKPDLGLIYGAPLLKPRLFSIPTHGTLGIHHGVLPDYRGVKTTFWAMANGEQKAGVTIQRINEGLDTGDIVAVGEVETAGKTLGQVSRELEELGVTQYIEAILQIKAGTARFVRCQGRGRVYPHPDPATLVRFHLGQALNRLARKRKLSETS